MKRFMTAVVAVLAVTTPLPARAGGPFPVAGTYAMFTPLGLSGGTGYLGGCQLAAVNDPTPGAVLGGPTVWNGVATLSVAPSIPGDLIYAASCWFKPDPFAAESEILGANTPLPAPAAFGAGRAMFTDDEFPPFPPYLCTHVTTFFGGDQDDCVQLVVTPVCPDQVCGDGGVLGQYGLVDSILCSFLIEFAPLIDDFLPTSGVLYVDKATGDLYLGGTAPGNLVWDCPPYVTP